MEVIFDEIFRSLGYLFIAGVVYLAWKTSNNNAAGGKYKAVLWKGFLWCAGIAILAAATLGYSSCEEQSDPLRGGCAQYGDDNYKPTMEQRVAKFTYVMILLYVPTVLGALQRKNSKPNSSAQ